MSDSVAARVTARETPPRTVWKFPTPLYEIRGPTNVIAMPRGAEVLAVGTQGLELCLWARVDPTAPVENRLFAFVGTGHPAPHDGRYVGLVSFDGPLVIHVFEFGASRPKEEPRE